MLPLGVVIPTKNSRPYLSAHVAGLKPWLDLAQEVVVVDSFSTDGTVEFLKANLSHPNLTFATHPPGLYASWNHGISQIRSEFFFMATVGDLITRDGIITLAGAAQELCCDVVISKSTFHDSQDRPLPDVFMPVDDVINTLNITRPQKLKKMEALAFAVAHPEAAMLGSSASNLYRTETMKRFPFPTSFGLAGDGAWAWLHVAEVVWGVAPGKFSSFLEHPKKISSADKKTYQASRPPHEVFNGAMKSWRETGAISEAEWARLDWDNQMKALEIFFTAKTDFDRRRNRAFPWIFNPRAWASRIRRERAAKALGQMKQRMLEVAI